MTPWADVDAVMGALAVVGGARFGSSFVTPSGIAVAVGLAVVAVALHGRTPRPGPWGVTAVLVVLVVIGAGSMHRALAGLGPPRSVGATVTAELVSDPVPQRFSTSAVARVRHRHVLLTASGATGSRLALLEAGDVVTATGRLRPLSRFERRYRWQHVVARYAVRDVLGLRRSHGWLARASRSVRARVLRGTGALAPTERALDAAFLLGDTRAIPGHVARDFRRAGLSHLLAVSGANVAFVLALVAPLTRRLPLGGRFVAGAGVLLVFGAMTRWQPSVLRAVAMAVVALAAQWAGRPVSVLRVLCLAAALLVIADPFLIHSVGFGLSCGACAGIALLAGPIERRLPGPAWVREACAVTAAAQIGVAPVLLPVFGVLPLVALPANLLAAPAVGPLTMGGLAGAMVGGALHGGRSSMAHTVQLPVVGLIRYVSTVAAVAARFPLALGPRDVTAAVALVALASGAGVLIRVRYARPP